MMSLETAIGRAYMKRGGDAVDYARERYDEMTVDLFTRAKARFFEKFAEWGSGYESSEYVDAAVAARLEAAARDLVAALRLTDRMEIEDALPEIEKRAADLINQAVFAADVGRIRATRNG